MMMLEFVFLSPTRLHPGSDRITTAELAQILEKKYGLVSGFTKFTEKELLKRIEKIALKYLTQKKICLNKLEQAYNRDLSTWLQDKWRIYINDELHNIKTKIAQDEDRPSFIDTGDYFKSLVVQLKLKK